MVANPLYNKQLPCSLNKDDERGSGGDIEYVKSSATQESLGIFGQMLSYASSVQGALTKRSFGYVPTRTDPDHIIGTERRHRRFEFPSLLSFSGRGS